MWGFRGQGRDLGRTRALGIPSARYRLVYFLSFLVGLLPFPAAETQTLQHGLVSADPSVDLAAPDRYPLPRLVVDCVVPDPAKIRAQAATPNVDHPTCSTLSPHIVEQSDHDLFKLSHADVAVKLGLTGGEQGLGLMRALASVSHFLNAGPLGGWQLHADAQIARPADLEAAYLVDEQVHLSVTPPFFAGWNLHFDAKSQAEGGLDQNNALERGLTFSADLSHSFMLPGATTGHELHLRLDQEKAQSRISGTDQQSKRASFGYSHVFGLSSVSSDLAVIRTQPLGADATTSMRVEIKFARPF